MNNDDNNNPLKFWQGVAYSIVAGVVLWIVVWWIFNC
jgi:hypothetical protein